MAVEVDEARARRRARSRRCVATGGDVDLVRREDARRSPTTAIRPGRPGAPVPSTSVPPVISRSASSVTRPPAARPAGGPAPTPRAPSPCGAGTPSRDMTSAGSSESMPWTGATIRGSTAMRSASLPGSSEPITSSWPSARAPSYVPSRSQSSGPRAGGRGTGCARASAITRRPLWMYAPARMLAKIDSSGPADTSESQADADPGGLVRGEGRRPTPGTGSTPGSGRSPIRSPRARATSRGREVDRVGQDRARPEAPGAVVDVEVVDRVRVQRARPRGSPRGPPPRASASTRRPRLAPSPADRRRSFRAVQRDQRTGA